MYQNLALIAAFVFVYSITSKGLERTPFSGAVIYTTFGVVCGPLGLGLLNLEVNAEGLRTIAELTLALVLFTDAASTDLGILRKSYYIPQRLLLIGLPLTIVFGIAAGLLIFEDLALLEIAILATILAPTDAALCKAIVTDEKVPAGIREGLNVESGLNDGICVPILFIFLALAVTGGEDVTWTLALKLVAEEIGIGIAVGTGVTLLGSFLLQRCLNHDWVTKTWRQLPVVALSLCCFALAQTLGGSGFIASFTGGLLFGALTRHHKHTLLLAAESTGETLALFTWVIFGAVVAGKFVAHFTWEAVVYACLSLTVVRMLPVFLALTGVKLRADEKLFMGWFGPRGLASIVFAVIVINAYPDSSATLTITVVCTVALSIVAHGLSAKPLVAILSSRINGNKTGGN